MENKNSSNSTQVKCAWCSGSGRWNASPGNPTFCIVCGGKGRVSVAGYAASQCRQCRGRGRSNPISPCLTCAGTGWEKVL